jgi:ATP-binding cassette, subfamily C (CFTR/MRP), member 1
VLLTFLLQVDQITRAFRNIHDLWAGTLQIAVAIWLLSYQIGFAAVGPIVVSVISVALTALVAPKIGVTMVSWLEKTQERVGM